MFLENNYKIGDLRAGLILAIMSVSMEFFGKNNVTYDISRMVSNEFLEINELLEFNLTTKELKRILQKQNIAVLLVIVILKLAIHPLAKC